MTNETTTIYFTFEEWSKRLQTAAQARETLPFVIGDLLLHGEKFFGEEAQQGIAAIEHMYQPQTLANFRWVAQAFPLESGARDPNVPHRVYEVLAPVADKKVRFALAKEAAKSKWTIREANKQMAALTDESESEPDPEPVDEEQEPTGEVFEETTDHFDSPKTISTTRGKWNDARSAVVQMMNGDKPNDEELAALQEVMEIK